MILVPLAVAAEVAEVQPATLRKWVERGIITRHEGGYDVIELLHWIDTIRNTDKARGAVVANHVRYQKRRDERPAC